jgi:hypothetical protein
MSNLDPATIAARRSYLKGYIDATRDAILRLVGKAARLRERGADEDEIAEVEREQVYLERKLERYTERRDAFHRATTAEEMEAAMTQSAKCVRS